MKQVWKKIILSGMLSALLLLSVCCFVYAQDMTEVPEVTVSANAAAQGQPRAGGFHGSLGAGVYAGQSTVGERRVVVFPAPFVSLRYSDWAYWRLANGGVWLVQSPGKTLKLGVGLGLRLGWKADDDDPLLQGMADRHASLDGSINAVWWNPIVALRVSYYHDLLSVSDGAGAMLSISRRFPIGSKFSLIPFAGVEWQSRRLVQYYYGVRPEEATAGRPEYHGRDSVNLRSGFFAAYRLNQAWSLFGAVQAKWLDSGISDSPIVLDRCRVSSFLGAGWRF
jgi:outer membrane protein